MGKLIEELPAADTDTGDKRFAYKRAWIDIGEQRDDDTDIIEAIIEDSLIRKLVDIPAQNVFAQLRLRKSKKDKGFKNNYVANLMESLEKLVKKCTKKQYVYLTLKLLSDLDENGISLKLRTMIIVENFEPAKTNERERLLKRLSEDDDTSADCSSHIDRTIKIARME